MKKRVLFATLVLILLAIVAYSFFVSAADQGAAKVATVNDTTGGDYFGYSVATGDVNNDGYADLIVGAPIDDNANPNCPGKIFVFFGTNDGIPDLMNEQSANITFTATDNFCWFGRSIASGDINNDSYADIIVGDYKADPLGVNDAGQAYVFFGADYTTAINENAFSYANITLNGTLENDYFGYSVASGDVNNDNYSDVIVGAYGTTPSGAAGAGQVFVFFGADYTTAINNDGSIYANITLNGTVAYDWFGKSVASGDINNDSYADIISGIDSAVGGAPSVYAFFGADYTTAVNQNITSYANITLNDITQPVASGDINNDSYADIIVGNSGANDGAGQVFVFFGANYTAAISETASVYANITVNGSSMNCYDNPGAPGPDPPGCDTTVYGSFGVSVASGDINNDGYADLIVGAHKAGDLDATNTGAGQAYVFFGADYTTVINQNESLIANITLNGTVGSDYFGFSVASGDVNNDNYKDIIVGAYQADPSGAANAGQAYVYVYDGTNPVVTLDAPSSGSTDTDGEVNFTFTAIEDHPDQCSLYINSTLTDWALNQSTTYSNNTQASIAINLTDGTYTWNIECSDTALNSAFNDTNYTITVSNSAPSVTLNSLSDNAYDSDGLDITFNFTTTETYPDECTLWFSSNATNWEQNETIAYSSGVQHNFSSLNLTDAVYTWNVECNDTSNNPAFASANRTLTVDTLVPTTPTLTVPTNTNIHPRDSISYICESSDATAGISKWTWTLTKPQEGGTVTKTGGEVTSNAQTFSGDDINLAGAYTVVCEAEDKAGHKSSSSSTFSVYYSHVAEEAATSGGGGGAKVDLSTTEEAAIQEQQGTITTFTLDGTTIHTITITEVDETAGTVTLTIESDPITITLTIGETEEVDVDGDGTKDISLTLNSIKNGVADITTKRLAPLPEKEVPTEEVPPTEKPAEVTPPTQAKAASKTWQWILIIAIIAVIAAGYWFTQKKK